jgi:hypothetical protein
MALLVSWLFVWCVPLIKGSEPGQERSGSDRRAAGEPAGSSPVQNPAHKPLKLAAALEPAGQIEGCSD